MTAQKPRTPWAQWPACGLLTTADVVRVLKVSASQVRAWAASGALVGEEAWSGQWFFRKRDVITFWEATGGRVARLRGRWRGQLPLPLVRRRMAKAALPGAVQTRRRA